MGQFRTIITGTGCYIPSEIKTNRDFAINTFYGEDHFPVKGSQLEVVDKLKLITGIEERRYAPCDLSTSDIGAIAAKKAIEDSNIDPETLDQLIVAHNYGNVMKHNIQSDTVPSIAARIKHTLGIRNPNCVGYDVLFGCPGWLQGVIQADAFFKAGIAKKALVVGAETLSRVIDVYDRDSMIFSDGAGACVLEFNDDADSGILSCSTQSHSMEEAYYISFGKSNFPGADQRIRYIKMKGRKVYEYALKHVPEAMKDCFDKTGLPLDQLKKIFIHQANEKMDEAILRAFYKLYNSSMPADIMPMNIHNMGNSSVATIPTLYDMVRKETISGHRVAKGDVIIFASVGAGMNINAVCYRV
ncbi:ketoacyl-ACP synthase III [Panacibacter ginsenosidivorans]|uniref:Ketoacyl-ACP synthase III n=1 Tax=Panacibacter ginsenosidivorans TaxID=1813871 RepID=A0A5B8VAT8_9BACT|nr:ketoacyl-ACP synthase III [Panacibacter ginsenosidivorans]QEC67991.1 ketoacyl-ACP synthase III [Panacibacter ginsenosidivorans]